MADLTVTEKHFWQDRIRTRFEAAIDLIEIRHATSIEQARNEARVRAVASLGMTKHYEDLEKILAEEAALARRKRRVQRSMLAILQHIPFELTSVHVSYHANCDLGLPTKVFDAIHLRTTTFLKQTLSSHAPGLQIVLLREAQQELIDRVWLAESPEEVEPYWDSVRAHLDLAAPFTGISSSEAAIDEIDDD